MIMSLRSSCELETYIVAVERIKEYTEAETEVQMKMFKNAIQVQSKQRSNLCLKGEDEVLV